MSCFNYALREQSQLKVGAFILTIVPISNLGIQQSSVPLFSVWVLFFWLFWFCFFWGGGVRRQLVFSFFFLFLLHSVFNMEISKDFGT